MPIDLPRLAPLNTEFSVCQFFADGTNEYVRRFVTIEEAVNAFRHYCHSVGAQIGFVSRVIITDGLDMTAAEWVYGKGLVFPPKPASDPDPNG